jgi:hypothetical protein
MNFYPHRTVEEQANRLPEELRKAYLNSQIDRIKIFDGKETIELTGYAEYSYLDEKSYKTQPVRSQNGAIEEIEEYATFFTPRLIVKYNMMGIDDYRSFMKMIKGRNAFAVQCYDPVEDKIVTNEMYVATPSMPIIYQQYLAALGIQEYAIEMIGTNSQSKISFSVLSDDGQGTYEVGLGDTWRDVSQKLALHFEINGERVVYMFQGNRHDLIMLTEDTYKYVSPDDFVIEDFNYVV